VRAPPPPPPPPQPQRPDALAALCAEFGVSGADVRTAVADFVAARRAGAAAPRAAAAPAPAGPGEQALAEALRRAEDDGVRLRLQLSSERRLREKYANKLKQETVEWMEQVHVLYSYISTIRAQLGGTALAGGPPLPALSAAAAAAVAADRLPGAAGLAASPPTAHGLRVALGRQQQQQQQQAGGSPAAAGVANGASAASSPAGGRLSSADIRAAAHELVTTHRAAQGRHRYDDAAASPAAANGHRHAVPAMPSLASPSVGATGSAAGAQYAAPLDDGDSGDPLAPPPELEHLRQRLAHLQTRIAG
jgi:hypothetical protein